MKTAILFSDFGPYHVARIEALAAAVHADGGELVAFRFTEKSGTYGWKPVAPEGIETVTLAKSTPSGAADALRVALAFFKALRAGKIKAVFLPSYSPLPNLLCLLATKLAGAKAIMMNESWKGTERAGLPGRLAKHLLLRLFDGALVGGRPQAEYAAGYGIAPEKIFTGYDVVDVDHFAHEAAKWKEAAPESLPVANLPKRYFLNLGRFVAKKNLGTLIEAYAAAVKAHPDQDVALVLVGSGVEEPALLQKAKDLGLPVFRDGEPNGSGPRVVLYPFQQIDLTPLFFARAEAFILPSSHEEWGLVVNEAMACGTPVIVSRNAGCAADLVVEGRSGFSFNPSSTSEQADILGRFLADSGLKARMGLDASRHIARWKPDRFGREGLAVAKRTMGLRAQSARVVFLVESLAVRSGGTALEVATIASAISEATDHEVSIVTCTDDGPHLPIGDRVQLIRLSGARPSPGWLPSVLALRRILRESDVVFGTGIWGLLDGLGIRLTLSGHTALFLRICGMLQPYILERNRWKKQIGLALWARHNLRTAKGLIVNSRLERDQLKALGCDEERILLIRNGITPPLKSPARSEARRTLGLADTERVLLYLGRIHPKKGLHLFLEAMQQVHSNGSSLPKLLIGGTFADPDFEEIVRQKAGALPGGTVFFTGEVTGERKENLFAAADLFILPSESEGLPNAVLEAMVRGIPAIVTPGCNLPEIADYKAGRVVDFSIDAFREVCLWASTASPEDLACAGANARRLIAGEFSLEKTVTAYDELVREHLRSRS